MAGEHSGFSPGLRPSHLIGETRSGVKGSAVLVEGDVGHRLDGARGYPGCHRHGGRPCPLWLSSCDRTSLPEILDQDGHVVNIPESPISMNNHHGVMARRPGQGKSILYSILSPGHRPGSWRCLCYQVGLGNLRLHVRDAEVGPGNVLKGGKPRL